MTYYIDLVKRKYVKKLRIKLGVTFVKELQKVTICYIFMEVPCYVDCRKTLPIVHIKTTCDDLRPIKKTI